MAVADVLTPRRRLLMPQICRAWWIFICERNIVPIITTTASRLIILTKSLHVGKSADAMCPVISSSTFDTVYHVSILRFANCFDLLHKEAQRDPGFVSSVAFIELQLRVCTQHVKRNAQISTNPIEKCKPRPLNRLILTGWSYIK